MIILTVALSRTFKVLGSAMSCSNRECSRVLSGNVSHLPITTKSISLENKTILLFQPSLLLQVMQAQLHNFTEPEQHNIEIHT